MVVDLLNFLLGIILLASLFGLVVALVLAHYVLAHSPGTSRMQKISAIINEGANTYLKRQFKTIVLIIVFLTAALFFTAKNSYLGGGRAAAFLLGAFFSGLTGVVGMNVATRANTRVTAAARKSYKSALELAFRAGATTGMLVVGLGLLGATLIYIVFREQAAEVLVGFGFGGSLMALFMRVGGGIYTKAADVGADLVGKIEKGIPEDDPRNAAVVADQVGDNVGDCAGMAADLFESYAVTLAAAMILGGTVLGLRGIIFPLLLPALGILSSALGIAAVRGGKEESAKSGIRTIERGFALAALVSIAGFWWLSKNVVADSRFFVSTSLGIILAGAIFLLTEYFTGNHPPVKEIAKKSQTGAAPTILAGIVSGFESTTWAILLIGGAILLSLGLFKESLLVAYSISLTGMGMLSLTGLIVSMDSFGPIADNAQGIAEMAHLKGKETKILPYLDSIGNTTKATTKGFAIATAVVAAVSLFESYLSETGLGGINVANPPVFVGLLIGGAIPFLFSALTIQAVSRCSFAVVEEVRRQFAQIPGLMAGRAKPDYTRVVDLTTKTALHSLLTPAFIAVLTPILIGFLLKAEALGGFLAGTILTGQLLAVFMANAGGAWDNAKKMIEDGLYGGKGSESHKAAVVGDTVGDPLKDTSGPALNPLIKVINLVALIVAPLVIRTTRLSPLHWWGIAAAFIVLGVSFWRNKNE